MIRLRPLHLLAMLGVRPQNADVMKRMQDVTIGNGVRDHAIR